MKLKETVTASDENKYINLNEDHRKYFEGLLKGYKVFQFDLWGLIVEIDYIFRIFPMVLN